MSYEPNGCFGAFRQERLVGTVTTTTYSSELAWIGMMLVDPELRRRGIATALMERAVSYLRDKNVECIKLDATPDGEFVYSKLRFEEEWTFKRWKRDEQARTRPEAESKDAIATVTFSAALLGMDRRAFGGDRSIYLKRLSSDSSTIIKEDGLGMVRKGYLASYLGPVSATTPQIARSIIQDVVTSVDGPLFWDIPSPNVEAERIARDFGFNPVRTLKRMRRGACIQSADLSMLFALADPATG